MIAAPTVGVTIVAKLWKAGPPHGNRFFRRRRKLARSGPRPRKSRIEACALGVLTRARIALGDLLRVEVADGSIVHRVFEIARVAHDVVLQPAFRTAFVPRLVPRALPSNLAIGDLPADGAASA